MSGSAFAQPWPPYTWIELRPYVGTPSESVVLEAVTGVAPSNRLVVFTLAYYFGTGSDVGHVAEMALKLDVHRLLVS